MNYIMRVNTLYPMLSKSEKKIADYLQVVGIDIIYKTLQEVSHEVKVGEATVLRFCRKIGFDGFQNLKLEIAKQNSFSVMKTPNEDYTENIAQNMCNAIHETKNALNKEILDLAVDMLNSADNVFICGSGSSGEVAKETQQQLLRYGKICTFSSDSHFQLASCAIAKLKDVVIAFTLSGSTIDTIDCLKLAKKNGAKIIVITNYILSPSASLADCILLTVGKESPLDGGSFTAKASQHYISDILITGYALKNKEAAKIKGITAEAAVLKALQ